MRYTHLPESFTRLGHGDDGREYIQCTRTGTVLVQTDDDAWSHFATAREWRARTAARLYPELIHLQRALKAVGSHEEVEGQLTALREAMAQLEQLGENLRRRAEVLERRRGGRLVEA
jgi:hypothetical protein